MKKWFLIFAFILAFQSNPKLISVLIAQEELVLVNPIQQDADIIDVKKVIEIYLQNFAKRDINSTMTQISKNFSGNMDGIVLDYDGFQAALETSLKRNLEIIISEIKIDVKSILNDKAVANVEHRFQTFNINRLENTDVIIRIQLILAREGKSWKIVSRNKIQ